MLFRSNRLNSSQEGDLQPVEQQPVNANLASASSAPESQQQQVKADAAEWLDAPQPIRLFRKSSMAYSGPETLFENEAWSFGRSSGIFRRNRGSFEEPSLSSDENQQ